MRWTKALPGQGGLTGDQVGGQQHQQVINSRLMLIGSDKGIIPIEQREGLSPWVNCSASPSTRLQCGSRPCFSILRMRVSDILDLLAAGATRDESLEDYPCLEDADASDRAIW